MAPRGSVAAFVEHKEVAMRITIIGAGNVGQALGAGWRESGDDVSYALRAATVTAPHIAHDVGTTAAALLGERF